MGEKYQGSNPFERVDDLYSKVRPSYPSSTFDVLTETLGYIPRQVADIGAGTGKMTRLFLERGTKVYAIEPAQAMREQLHETVCSFRDMVSIHDATATETTLENASVDIVIYAQSWHWVDSDPSAREAHRILVSDGIVSAVWNQMDVSVPWVHRLTRIMRSGDVRRPDKAPEFGEQFQIPQCHVSHWTHSLTTDQVLDLGKTRSSWLRSDATNRMRMEDNLKWYLYEFLGFIPGALVDIPMLTLTWAAKKYDATEG